MVQCKYLKWSSAFCIKSAVFSIFHCDHLRRFCYPWIRYSLIHSKKFMCNCICLDENTQQNKHETQNVTDYQNSNYSCLKHQMVHHVNLLLVFQIGSTFLSAFFPLYSGFFLWHRLFVARGYFRCDIVYFSNVLLFLSVILFESSVDETRKGLNQNVLFYIQLYTMLQSVSTLTKRSFGIRSL